MKKALIFAVCFLFATQVVAATNLKECMIQLPETVEIEGLKEPLIKVKDRLVDHEAAQKGLGYSQNYQNVVCRMTVYVYSLNLEKITKEVIEADFLRVLAEIDYVYDKVHKRKLTQFHSYEVPLFGTHYLANVLFTDATSEAVMEGVYRDYILKGRATCRQLEGAEQEVNANIALKHLEVLLTKSAQSLDNCLK